MFLTDVRTGLAQPRGAGLAGRSTVYAPHGAIATSQPLATAAGLAVLQRSGNAVDAAVTAAAVLNVVEPMMTGVGGDAFALFWLAQERRLLGLNGSGRSGSLLTRDELIRRRRQAMPETGAESVTVPGALAAWHDLLARYGTIGLAEALAPAIALAEEGFPVTPVVAEDWAIDGDVVRADDGGRHTYLVNGERPPLVGEWFRNPDLARSFRLIGKEGPGVFYGGALGEKIVTRVRELGGFLTVEDIRNHRSEWVEPISVAYQGYRLYELPPNSQGIAALEMLRILEPYDLRAMGHNSATYLHHLIEAKKLAFADLQRYVGDPADTPVPAGQLLTEPFIAGRRARLDPGRAAQHVEPGSGLTASDTIYLSAADRHGNMVSFINSLAGGFGSGVVVPGTGIALQNRGAGFTLAVGLPNSVGPRKRPFHTIIPAFVTRADASGAETPWLSYGVMGGSMQPQGHVQILLNLLVFGMDLQQSLDQPRFRHIAGLQVALEGPIPETVRRALRELGHEVLDLHPGSAGGAQAVMRRERGYAAASDPRKDGMAAGH